MMGVSAPGCLMVSTHTANLRFWQELFLSKVETKADYARTHQQLLVSRLRLQVAQRQQLRAQLGRETEEDTLDAFILRGKLQGCGAVRCARRIGMHGPRAWEVVCPSFPAAR